MTLTHHTSTARRTQITVRDATRDDHPAIRGILRAAYGQFARTLPHSVFRPYQADLLDLDTHARHGSLVVAEVDGVISGSGAFYPDTSVQCFGWPRGWAGGRGLAVHPARRGQGLASVLLADCERRAREAGAPVFAFHTASFMAAAVELYEHLGYRRAPEYDVDLAEHYSVTGLTPIPVLAYCTDLTTPSLTTDERTPR
jgi:predicted N-acetyltransferase YhbS